MHTHAETWGHVSYAGMTPEALELAEEENETLMLYCRYGRKAFRNPHTVLAYLLPQSHDVIFNPNTLNDLEAIFSPVSSTARCAAGGTRGKNAHS